MIGQWQAEVAVLWSLLGGWRRGMERPPSVKGAIVTLLGSQTVSQSVRSDDDERRWILV